MTRSNTILPLMLLLFSCTAVKAISHKMNTTYYIDSRRGNDRNSGKNQWFPWKSIAALANIPLHPGDSIRFKRGSFFTGPLNIESAGTAGEYITLTDYGSKKDHAPAFTNPVFAENNYGNCVRVSGSYVLVENLYFSGTAAATTINYNGDGWLVWQMGAIHIGRNAEHCIVRNNEITDCVAGIRSNGAYALIERNYIHDCNRVLKQWNWGPLGIWLGADHQEVCYNRIFNYSAADPRITWGPDSYGGGADGGALEIDDARYDKSDISIHHNYTRGCQGFLEVTWTDVKQNPAYRNFQINHNVSDDYQQFIALWRGEACRIENNTIIRRKVNANDWGVFNITQRNAKNVIRNNIIVTEKNVVIFNAGKKETARPQTIIAHNLYYAAADSLHMGKEGPGDSAIFGNPAFVHYRQASKALDFTLTAESAAVDNMGRYMGAFGYKNKKQVAVPVIALAQNGKALIAIQLPPHASATQQFAAAELARYLQQISGAAFNVRTAPTPGSAITIVTNKQLPIEDYRIFPDGKRLVLSAGSDRAVLYAVYDLLHRLGCVWLAPQFSYYNGQAEYIPTIKTLRYDASVAVYEHPQLAYRKLDVEEGLSHTTENLQQIIAWMPKVRYNVLMIPLNYQGTGRVKWDQWREALIPELKKRAILVEVGGHGYQNFLNAKMEGGTLFNKHPDWFGKNKNGEPDGTDNLVFNTANAAAVSYFITNIVHYLRAHPEIDIFDCWPPDVAKWAECPEMAVLGSAADRQAALMNQVDSAITTIRPGLRLEIIAYGQVLLPPQHVALNKNILVDICPINQSFEKPIYDPALTNTEYAKAMAGWRQHFSGDIGLYSYYRKYAWRSLPNILTHFMQKELEWYGAFALQGISTYAEPGDWYTYELNHYTLAGLAWNPNTPVDPVMSEYMRVRYGEATQTALTAYRDLERVVRNYCSLPYTSLKPAAQTEAAVTALRSSQQQVDAAADSTPDKAMKANLGKLSLMLEYAIDDLALLQMRASGAAATAMEGKVKQLVQFLEQHEDEGVFILSSQNNMTRFLKHYNSIQ